MTNTSATGGFLLPTGTEAVLEDDALADLMQQVVKGITGLAIVRPRWQMTPPDVPAITVDWCAVGIQSRTPDANAWEGMQRGSGGSSTLLRRHETVDVLASFYGPHAGGYAGALRDGLYLAQNRDVLRAQSVAFRSAGSTISMPELVNNRWLNRCDIQLGMAREIRRSYPVLSLLDAAGTINGTGQPASNWTTENTE